MCGISSTIGESFQTLVIARIVADTIIIPAINFVFIYLKYLQYSINPIENKNTIITNAVTAWASCTE